MVHQQVCIVIMEQEGLRLVSLQFSPIYLVFHAIHNAMWLRPAPLALPIQSYSAPIILQLSVYFRPLLERENDFCRCLSEMFPELKV